MKSANKAPSGRRVNPYEDPPAAASESHLHLHPPAPEDDLRNFFMDGLYLSSEKKQKQKPETPLDPNEFQQLTQIGDELVDSFYKLSDTLGNSQQGLLQGAQVTTTGGSHKRHQSGSSILNSAMKVSSQRYGERK